MKILKPWLPFCIFSLFLYAGPSQSSEIGFSIGSYFKDSDINQSIEIVLSSNPWEEYIEIINREIYPPDPLRGPFGVKMGERSSASYLGFTYSHKFYHPSFELEHTFGGAFSAEMSVKPHIFLYSSNLNFILPWYPKIFLWRIKPFVCVGLGYVYNFGENFGLKREKEEVPPYQYFPSSSTITGIFSTTSAVAGKFKSGNIGG